MLLRKFAVICSLLTTFALPASTHAETKDPAFAQVDKLMDEQKNQAALDQTFVVLKDARSKKNDHLTTKALIKATQLQMSLHGYETAVKFLKDEAWPTTDATDRVLLNLYYAHSLMAYHGIYSWEIQQREKTVSNDKVDLKAWTTQQIGTEITRAFDSAMKETTALNQPVNAVAQEYIANGSYPIETRPFLRDVVVYLAAQHLANQVFWGAKEASEVYKLDFKRLSTTPPTKRITDESIHPLERAISWLSENRDVHRQLTQPEAALEASYQILSTLHAATQESEDRSTVRESLKKIQSDNRAQGWWARGQSILAEFILAEDRAGRLIDARNAAIEGRSANSSKLADIAKQFCEAIIFRIERPTVSFQEMENDSIGKRSILVNYSNLKKLYFRAYAFDVQARLKEKVNGGGRLFEYYRDKQLIENKKPMTEWSVDLPATPDFASHRLFVTPKNLKNGGYVIVASIKPNFASEQNIVQGQVFIASDLVLQTSQLPNGVVEVRAIDGESGQAVKDAKVTLSRYTYEKKPEDIASQMTDAKGYTTFKEPAKDKNEYYNYALLATWKTSLAFKDESIYFYRNERTPRSSGTLVFTDRAVYRPEQKILFKVVGYHGDSNEGVFKTAEAGETVAAVLYDLNNQKVGTVTLKYNSFGTASGEFKIPSGRPLGGWRLAAGNGQTSIKVEEYKRPTFETEWNESDKNLRLNKPAHVTGQAKYYFGLPVTSGRVKWRVSRTQMVPWWWGYYGWWMPRSSQTPEVIASGTTSVGADGKFAIDFTPNADERKAAHSDSLSYNFTVIADVTDDGGETRTAEKSFRLGFVAVEAKLAFEKEFFSPGKTASISSHLTDLNGHARKGTGIYKISRVTQPKTSVLPFELTRDLNSNEYRYEEFRNATDLERYATPDDLKRARWETFFTWEQITSKWPAGTAVAEGRFNHDVSGDAEIKIDSLKEGGVYRISYETKDDFGATFNLSRDFVVAAAQTQVSVPLIVIAERSSVKVGETARFFIDSGLQDQPLTIERVRAGKLLERTTLARGGQILEIPITMADRGGFSVVVSGLRDHQNLKVETNIDVPWSDRELKLEFATLRDRMRPGSKETVRISVAGEKADKLGANAAEVLAYMYDRSLDLFATQVPQSPLSLYPNRQGVIASQLTLGTLNATAFYSSMESGPYAPSLYESRLQFPDSYGIGGPGSRGGYGVDMEMADAPAPSRAMNEKPMAKAALAAAAPAEPMGKLERNKDKDSSLAPPPPPGQSPPATEMRSNFSETAFFAPHLVTNASGLASVEFEVPDSVTSWHVLAHAITRDLRGGSVSAQTKTVKDLMVRPYIPRFMREGDSAEIKVQVNNASTASLSGNVEFDIKDADSGQSALADFGLKGPQKKAFTVAKDGSMTVGFKVSAPKKVGSYVVHVRAKTGSFSDGEIRPFPVLPSRMHLAQSRFVALKNQDKKVLEFKDLANAASDPSLINEKMVVTVDGQLFYGVLQSLPYLVTYPYECTEQTLNRFLSTGIVTSLFKKYPAVEKMAREFSKRDTRLEKFDEPDANRRILLEETPWLQEAQGGAKTDDALVNVLNSEIAKAERDRALARLRKMQLPSGAFPWFEGGRPDRYMTLYLLVGFSRALEFQVDVPKDMTVKAWSYIRKDLDSDLQTMMAHNCWWEEITMANFAFSSFPDSSWTGGAFDEAYRKKLLDYSFSHWKQHSPLVKGYLALTLKRMNRLADAKLVWESVMDSAKSDPQLGTYWAAEDRSWLWYNDTIETHAFSLRVQMELDQQDKHNDGLVQWLFLNKKLNHWKSTRATAESIYALTKYLDKTGGLGNREVVSVATGSQRAQFTFEPDKYTGKMNQLVIPGDKVTAADSKITVEKSTQGFAFASATWHFSTEKMPTEASGDFFSVTRKYFKREQAAGGAWTLRPLNEGTRLEVGDQVEVQLSLRTKHEAEYVHLRDPRAAGLEPENVVSGYKWDLGLSWYEETRNSGSNFFFSRLPVGEYTFKYRLRANMAGSFRIGPATVQSMYAPEFNAYSDGTIMKIEAAK